VYSSGSRGHNWALFERMRDVWQLQDIWSLHSRLGRLHLSDIGNEAFDQVDIVLLDDHLRHTQRLIWRDRRDMQLYDGDLPDQVFASISREFLAACVMPVTLADLFSTSGDRPIEVDGRMVHRKFQRQLQGWMEVHVKRLQYNTLIPQGLRIKSGKVELEYDGQRVRDLVLWADSSPQDCMLRVIGQQGAVLKCWNVWQSGGVAALQGPSDNAGMVIEEMSDGVRLLCSDGVGEPDFEDFIVELRFDRATQHESELSSRFRS
jgi:hypothetical protein